MHIRTLGLSLACITSSALLATETAIIDFKTVIQDTAHAIKTIQSNPEKQKAAITALSEAAISEALAVLRSAHESAQLGDLVETHKINLQDHLAGIETVSEQWVTHIVQNAANQTVGYLALHSELEKHSKVIVKFGASWCPPCQMVQPIFERCASEYNDDIRVISIDISQFQVLGIPVENIPMILFFKDGKEVYRQVGLNNDLLKEISTKHKNIQSEALEKDVLEALEAELRAAIKEHLS